MADTQQIALELRRRAADVGYCDAAGTIRCMRRAADEIERLQAELVWLRGFAESVMSSNSAEEV